jgi:ATP-dependent exoDNAse (exonuclease V) beta subunit
VVVDYKTEALPGGQAEAVTAKYAPQLNLYAQAWEQCTGRAVKERILFFVQAGRAVRISP